jgi:hypothetical protein
MMARAFSGWAERVSWCKRMRLILERSARRLLYRRSAAAFRGWHEAAQMVKGKREGASMEQLQGQVAQLAVSDSCRQAGRHRGLAAGCCCSCHAAAYQATLLHNSGLLHAICGC